MRLSLCLALLPCAALALPAPAQPKAAEHPHTVLKNDKLSFKLYDIDAQKGFYRGTRFTHAGVFGPVAFAGHTLFGPWKGTHDPANHDDIVGPCDEFGIDSPLGYDEAKPGGTFLKIGVGELEKPKEARYSFATLYRVAKPLEWARVRVHPTVKENPPADSPTQLWRAGQRANGYGYQLTKVVRLDGPSVQLGYTLKNVGEKRIVTDFYNHNFFNVDGDPVGPNYSLAFTFVPKAQDLKGKFGDLVDLKGNELRFKRELSDGFVMAGLTGFDAKDDKHRGFLMRHGPSGVRVLVQHNYPFARFNLWGIKTTICPEPFLAIDLKPGDEMSWSIMYTFQHEPQKK